MSPARRIQLGALVVVLGGTACLQAWPFKGPYRCADDGTCGDGLVCDDGLCCRSGGEPACPTLPLETGACPSGGAPRFYFPDLDGDGFGRRDAGVNACARPVLTAHVDNGDDCDDSSANARPGGSEVCDGLDNDCDGVRDEGLAQRLFYLDSDGDDAGNPDGGLSACARPPGYSDNQGDCAPNDATIFPGAPERCNATDDDCDGVVDESPVEREGQSCMTGKPARCAAGTLQCIDSTLSCVATAQPQPDVCDGEDNDCDGQTDERPECGGPASFFAGNDVVLGALVAPANADLDESCAKPLARQGTWFPPNWLGTHVGQHFFFVEGANGTTWDLSDPDAKLRLSFAVTGLVGNAAQFDAGVHQPIVTLCNKDPKRFARYVPKKYLPMGNQLHALLSLEAPLDWTRTESAAGVDWTRIERLEVQMVAVPETTFTIRWNADGGFGQ